MVTPDSARLSALGSTVRLAAQVHDQSGQVMPRVEVMWASSSPGVATVDAAGLVTAVANGTTTITASASSATGSATVTVMQAVAAVAVSPANDTVMVGGILRLSASAEDANGHPVDAGEFAWASTDTSVAVVDSSGVVTGVGVGEVEVTATSGGVTGAGRLVVTAGLPATVEITPYAVHLTSPGDTVRLTAQVRDGAGRLMADVSVNWTSHNNSVAMVDASGLVTAVGYGEAAITATAGPAAGTATVTVAPPTDRAALESLFRSTGGPAWEDKTNWLTDAPLGRWHGVTTDGSGRVVGLELDSNNLVGPIPPRISWLTALRRLSLEDNSLSGPIPSEIGSLSHLDYLILSHNILSGEIPPEIGRLTAMTTMGLTRNKLGGRVPPEMGKLSRLTWLDLSHKDLTGGIPPELAIPGLQSLFVEGNLLHGPVPSAFLRAGLEHLGYVEPRYRNLYLCVPGTRDFVTWAARVVSYEPRFCNDSDRDALEALHEATGGASWTASPGWLSGPALGEWHGVETDALGKVVTLDLAGNGLSGELPPQLGHLAGMTRLRIGDNPLRGRLPASLTGLSLEELRYDGTDLCAPAEASFRAWLGTVRTHEGTRRECSALSDRDILALLYHATGGPNWSANNNWLTDAPLDDWHGVRADEQGRVFSLSLTYNNLRGVIPPELGQLEHLEDLRLYENPLTGPIPPELGNLSRLRVLYLMFTLFSGTIPPELGNLPALEELWLERIPLTGPIPPELGNLSRLRFLALNGSNLGGPIPPELGRLANLERLYARGNRFTGSIPREFGGLTRLNTLTLQDNRLTVQFPRSWVPSRCSSPPGWTTTV